MNKLDLTKKYKQYYTAKLQPELVRIEPAQFISICGKGDPSGRPFAERIEALYSTVYALKFIYKAKEKDFTVSKLEGLWWFDEKKFPGKNIHTSVEVPRSEWEYRLLIRLPEFVDETIIQEVKISVANKKNIRLAGQIEFYEMNEGTCIQILHIGPFSTELTSLKKLEVFSTANKLSRNGLHHEIYLSDFRRTEPDKLKTILREPVK